MSAIQKNIIAIKNKIREYEIRYGRKPGSVALLAASKTQSAKNISEAILAGQYEFGENYLQEALQKMAVVIDKNVIWHFIGSIQSNKIKKIAAHFSWVHSVSEIKTVKQLSEQRPSHLLPLNICLQVNVSEEHTKSGALSNKIISLAEYGSSLPRIKLRGLMAVPAFKNNFAEQRVELHKLRMLYDTLKEKGFQLDTLSMGMSDDMEAAVAEGATIVRIGTAIFGERQRS